MLLGEEGGFEVLEMFFALGSNFRSQGFMFHMKTFLFREA